MGERAYTSSDLSSFAGRFDRYFLTSGAESLDAYRQAIGAAQAVLERWYVSEEAPFSGVWPTELARGLEATVPCPEEGQDLATLLDRVGKDIVRHSAVVSHPRCVAHLHCPPLTPALAAEVIISATNQSMDSWDQSPAATLVEQKMVDWLCQTFGYKESGDGTFTSGGTQSNFMGLLLARDEYARHRLHRDVQRDGLPPEAGRFRIVCSGAVHFTVRQAASLLGLGEQAVVSVEPDAQHRLDPAAVEAVLSELHDSDLLPIAIVATAGTTDLGGIDPLGPLAEIARAHDIWLHVDAAYGGALILSDSHCRLLEGISEAHSIAVDFHKMFYQPISCGAFLVKDRSRFALMRLHADYLNPCDNEEDGFPDLVTKSIQTTRRFDALKLLISLEAVGKRKIAEMIDATMDLAATSAELIQEDPELELAALPTINTVVFRYYPDHDWEDQEADKLNREIRLALLRQGKAVIAQTRIQGRVFLKLTLLNPRTSVPDVVRILDDVKRLGRESRRTLLTGTMG